MRSTSRTTVAVDGSWKTGSVVVGASVNVYDPNFNTFSTASSMDLVRAPSAWGLFSVRRPTAPSVRTMTSASLTA